VSVANLPLRCAGATPAAISLGPITPIDEPITRRCGPRYDRDAQCTLPGSLAHTHAGRLVPASRPSWPARKSNPHSARCPAGAKLPATSCLGAFWTPAASVRGTSPHAGVQKPAQFRATTLVETVARAARFEVRCAAPLGPPTFAGYLSASVNYKGKATGSERVQWTPSASMAKVVRASN
jgi:hypothetical protein